MDYPHLSQMITSAPFILKYVIPHILVRAYELEDKKPPVTCSVVIENCVCINIPQIRFRFQGM